LINHRRIKLRLYQTPANIADRKNSTIPFPIPEEVCLEKGKQRKRKEKEKKII
jgi:predicted kinase